MNCKTTIPLTLMLMSGMLGTPAQAIVDPGGDFLPTFTNFKRFDLDLISVDAFQLNKDLHFEVGTAGRMNAKSGISYVFGIDRGAGTTGLLAGDPAIAPDVKFDALFEIRTNGTGTLTVFNETGGPTIIQRDQIFFFQNFIRAGFSASLLPSRGFAIKDYRYTVWSRDPGEGNAVIADITRTINLGAVPEPATWAMMIGGFCAVGCSTRFRRHRALA